MLRGHTGRVKRFPREAGDSPRLLLGGRCDRHKKALQQQGGGLRFLQNLFCGTDIEPAAATFPARESNSGPLMARSPGPGEFCAIVARPAPVQRALQIKTKDGGSPVPHPVLGHKKTSLGCARCAEHSPNPPDSKIVAETRLPKSQAHAARAAPKTLGPACIRPATSGARCLPAKMPKKGDNIDRNSKKSQKKQQKKYNVYSQKTVRIKEALREKQ